MSLRTKRLFACTIVLWLDAMAVVQAQTPNQLFIGPRPIAMGETFVAIADDGTAIYWNPAGLPYLRKYEANFAYADLFGIGLTNTYLSLFAPVAKRFVLGADWLRLGYDDVDNDIGLEFSQNMFHFSFAYKVLENLSIGANFKYVSMTGSEDKISAGKATGTGYDVGLLFSPSDWLGAPFDKLRFGVMVHDATGTVVTFDNGTSDTILQRLVRYGVSYRPKNNFVLGFDVDDRLHFGAEYWLLNTLALRGGWQKDLRASEGAMFSFGLGLARNLPHLEQVRANYAFVDHPTTLNTNQFSASIAFDLFPELIEIEKIEIGEIFASQYKHYSKTPIGIAHIRFNGKTRLKCAVEATTFKYSDPRGSHRPAELAPGDSLHLLPIRIVFDPSILEAETTPLECNIRISYLSGGRVRYEPKTSGLFTLHKRGTIDWAKGTAQAAAFIDPSDETVNQFANEVAKKFAANPEAAILSEEDLSRAVQIFNALGEIGIRYEKDPESPYARTSKGIDKIYYPTETLKRKKGDCDDTTVLYAALLENCDIPTALVAVPGHILLMFDTGILAPNRERLLLNEERYYSWRDSYWIPVETTLLGQSFLDAWQAGVEKMRTHPIEDTVEVRAAWQTYEPATLPEKALTSPYSEANRKGQDPAQDVARFKALKEAELAKLEQQVAEHPEDLNLRKRLALQYARWPWRGDHLEAAKKQYAAILAGKITAADSFAVYNNLANIFLLQEKIELETAETFYLRALAIARRLNSLDTVGIQLNRGARFLAEGNDIAAAKTYALVVKDSTFIPLAEHYLGFKIQEEDEPGRAAPDDKKKNKKVTKKEIRGAVKSRQLRSRALPAETGSQIEDVFYWAIQPKDRE